MTREYPPEVYGGAGVHVDFLVRELRRLIDVDVLCLGAARPDATAFSESDPRLEQANPALRIFSADLAMAAAASRHRPRPLPHLVRQPRPGTSPSCSTGSHMSSRRTRSSRTGRGSWSSSAAGYRLSSWAEQTAYEAADAVIAVSGASRRDVLASYPALDPVDVHVVHNGIDTELYRPDPGTDVVERLGVDPRRPSVVFVGRITRQKGVPHLLRAARRFDPAAQIVLLAGAADTPELAAETEAAVDTLRAERDHVVWVSEMLPREEVRQVLTHATVFVCPSIYEPLGIVNLEAMACATAVVASDVGGIPEVVADGSTGLLVHYDERDPDGVRAGVGRRRERARRRSGAGRGDGGGGPAAGHRRVRLGRRRPPYRRHLPLGPGLISGSRRVGA